MPFRYIQSIYIHRFYRFSQILANPLRTMPVGDKSKAAIDTKAA